MDIYSSAFATLLTSLDPIHHLGLRLALGALRSFLVESLYAESGLPSLSRHHTFLFLRSYVRLHQFSTSKITIPHALQSSFFSHPRLSRSLSVLDLNVLPFHTHSFPPFLPPQFALLPFLILPSLIHQLTSYEHFS